MNELALQDNTVNILVAINERYVNQFKVLAKSAVTNNPDAELRFFLIHSSLTFAIIDELNEFCLSLGAHLAPIKVNEGPLSNVPTTSRYPAEVYYRLLASYVLPSSVKRILYLDCDMLVTGSLKPLYDIDLEGMAFAAASHSGEVSPVDLVNQMRLGTDHKYFNTGIILMDTARARSVMTPDRLMQCVDELGRLIILPDQDVFNVVCGESCLAIDDEIWNYDTRAFAQYRAASLGEHDVTWVMANTAVLHFCGPRKPWKKSYAGRFGVLYKHYMKLAGIL